MNLTLRALAALLAYPSEELQANAGDIREAIAGDGALSLADHSRLDGLLRAFETQDLLDLQCAYSELFDRSRSLSLHLFEHVHGDSRERGQAMIDLGHALGLKLVAEGTEDEATLAILADMGCDIAQGYMIGRPMSIESLTKRLSADRRSSVA